MTRAGSASSRDQPATQAPSAPPGALTVPCCPAAGERREHKSSQLRTPRESVPARRVIWDFCKKSTL